MGIVGALVGGFIIGVAMTFLAFLVMACGYLEGQKEKEKRDDEQESVLLQETHKAGEKRYINTKTGEVWEFTVKDKNNEEETASHDDK